MEGMFEMSIWSLKTEEWGNGKEGGERTTGIGLHDINMTRM